MNEHLKKSNISSILRFSRSYFSIFLLFVFGNASILFAQQNTVKGKVTLESGEPLPGATVLEKGTKNGVQSDFDGNFSIKLSKEEATLVISYIGFINKEIAVKEGENISIVLTENVSSLDEIVVIGYGTTTIRKTTAAVSTIKTDNLVNLPGNSIGDALAGRTAGLVVTNSGGGVGSTPFINIRGSSIPNASGQIVRTSPILIIDGVTTTDLNRLHRMNPQDIESFTVLKDAEAVAVYGSKGGNGAIVVTTKRGKEGAMSINYGYRRNFSRPTILPEKLGSFDFVSLANNAADIDGIAHPYSDVDVQKYKDQSDPFNYPDVDWQNEVLKKYAQEERHDLSLTGGNEKTQYYASLSYLNQGSLYKFDTNDLDRYTYRMNLSNNFEKIGLKSNLSFFGSVQNENAPYSHYSTNYSATWSHIQNQAPINLAYTDLGLYSSVTDHPIVEIDPNSGYNKSEDRKLNLQLDLEWSVPNVDGLKLKVLGYYGNENFFRKIWRKNADQFALGSNVPLGQNLPSLSLRTINSRTYRIQPLITYEKTIEKNNIQVDFAYDETYSHDDDFTTSRENYILDVDQIFAGPVDSAKNSGEERESANAGYVGRFRYSYDSKYLLSSSIRYDGNDNFPKDRRWGVFYSGSLGWVLSKENFMESMLESLNIDFLKGRFSFGQTGLDTGISRFSYVAGYTLSDKAYVVDGQVVPGFSEGGLVSPFITWFERSSINTGIDFAMFNNRLSGSVDYFFYETKNFLVSPSQGSYTDPLGIALPFVNSDGKRRRAGWEFDVHYKDNIGDLFFDIGANFTKFDELWVNNPFEQEDVLKNPNTRTTHLEGIGTRSYLNNGFYGNSDDIINSPKRISSTKILPGDLRYTDVNGDGKIDGEDFVNNGKPSFARSNYGITLDMKYKAWNMNMHFQGTGDRHIYLADVLRNSSVAAIRYGFQTDTWTPENTGALYPRLISNSSLNGNNNGVTSDFWLVNSKYFRMKSLQVGYDFKESVFKDFSLNNFKLYLSATNLFTISDIYSKYKIDPETNSANNYGYPLQKVISIGLNVGF